MPHRGSFTLSIQLLVAPCIHALGVLLPLYIYSGTNCDAWSPVSSAISAHPNTQFYIIINPDDGPGSQPDPNYQACVSALSSSTNQVVLGYVDTTSGNTLADIDTYAGWDSSSRPTGIFLDGVPAGASSLSTSQGYVSHAKSQGFTFIALDPGQSVDSSYFSIADLINTYEDSYSSFNPSSLSGTLSKQSVTLVNAPATGSYSSVISQLEGLGVAAVYITNVPDSSSDLPVQLSEFVGEVASAGGGSTSSGSSSSGTTSSGSTSSGSTSSESNPSDPSNPSSPASAVSSSKSQSSSSAARPPSSLSSGHSSQSTTLKGSTAISSGQPSLPSSSSGVPNEAASTSHKRPPIAAIVGGVLGALVLLLAILSAYLYTRRRRRSASTGAPDVAPIVVEYRPAAADDRPLHDVKSQAINAGGVSAAPPSASAAPPSTGATYPHSAAPLGDWESRRASTGPPPSYSDNP
ncbi:Spherulation-specific family 4-domain-containing protein [Mycena latifolia]|nr:Spherulation-specific family 4-domain-containing protein [Mycena latifolia]